MSSTVFANFKLNENPKPTSAVVPVASEQNVTPTAKDAKEYKKYSTQNVLMLSLGGLAVIGASVLGVRGLRNRKIAQDTEKKSAEIMDIIVLKSTIADEFNAKRRVIFDKIKESAAEQEMFPEFSTIGELARKVKEIEASDNVLKNGLTELLASTSKIIKEKIKNLDGDKDWHELRKLRKSLIKLHTGSASVEEKNIAFKKIGIINDLLINKTYPEEVEKFENLYGIKQEAAYELVRKDFATLKEFDEAFKQAQVLPLTLDFPLRERVFTHMNRLSLSDVFPDESAAGMIAREKLNSFSDKSARYQEVIVQYHQEVSELAEEFRNSQNVKDLKQRVAQIRK